MASLAELLKAKSRDEVLQLVLAEMADPRHAFPLTDVGVGSVWRTIVEGDVQALADLYAFLPALARSGFADLASGDWLDLHAQSFYQLERKPSVFAEHTITLTAQSGFGPYDIPVNQLWVLAQPDKRFVNTTGGILLSGSSLSLRVRAESPGSEYNVAEGAINSLITALPGVTVTNGAGSLVIAGANVESDESLRRRLKLRWPAMGVGGPRALYEMWALEASESVTKVNVKDWHPRGEGTLDVILWGDGGIGSEDVAIVAAYIDERKMAYDVRVAAAATVTQDLTGTVNVEAGTLTQAEVEIQANLDALQAELPIGGTLYRAELFQRIQDAAGVINTVLTLPAADVELDDEEAAVFDNQLVLQEV